MTRSPNTKIAGFFVCMLALLISTSCSTDLDLDSRSFKCNSDDDCVDGYFCGENDDGRDVCLPDSARDDAGTDANSDASDTRPNDTGAVDAADTTEDTVSDAQDTQDAQDTSDTMDADAADTADTADTVDTADTCELRTFYADDDGDGHGNPDSSVEACEKPSGTVISNDDCDDNAASVFPGAAEDCGNGVDDDCDSDIDAQDDDCNCANGTFRSCYTGDANTAGVGECETGTKTCANGSFGACEGQVTPQSDVCDGLDNDCDGQTDEDYPAKGQSCTVGTGACERQGTRVCNSAGTGVTCDATAGSPSTESCNGVDDDCDGTIDEGVKTTYYADRDDDGHGLSGDTRQSCSPSGDYTATRGGDCDDTKTNIHPGATEQCNGIDDNCDGTVDPGCACTYDPGEANDADTDNSNGDGVCLNQSRDSSGVCSRPSEFENPEQASCDDGIDNDCDGAVDESAYRSAIGDSCTKNCECVTGGCWTQTGTCVHAVFVSSDLSNGNFPTPPDAHCQNLANSVGLNGTWKAIISTNAGSAKSRINISGKVVRLDGVKIADNGTDLWDGSLDNPLNVSEQGTKVSSYKVWTGTNRTGTRNSNICNSWSSNSSTVGGLVGRADAQNGSWIDNFVEQCDRRARMYCINGQ